MQVGIVKFEKYESDAVSNQALVIGYIKDGVMYDGESFGSLSGSYELKVREGGRIQFIYY